MGGDESNRCPITGGWLSPAAAVRRLHPVPHAVAFNADLYVLIATTVFLFFGMFTGQKYRIDRWEAIPMLLGFGGYVSYMLYYR